MGRSSPALRVWGLLFAVGVTLATFAFVRIEESKRIDTHSPPTSVQLVPGPLDKADHTASTAILVLGLALSLLWSAYLKQMVARQAEIEARIRERTADLEQERSFSNAVFAAYGAVSLVINRDGLVVRFNKAAEEFTGHTLAQVSAEPFFWERFMPAQEQPKVRAAFAYFQNGGTPKRLQYHWRNAAGELRLLDWTTSVLTNAQGAAQFLIAIGVDVTLQRRLEEEAQQKQIWLRTILDNLGEGVYTLDGDGKLGYINAQAEHMLGWTFAELSGKSVHSIIHHHRPDGSELRARDCPIYLAMHANEVYRCSEEVFFHRDGTPIPVKVSGAPLQVQGRHLGSVVMFADMAAERQLQQHLVRAKEAAEAAARLKSDFLSTMSHEIRTPLNGVIGMTDLLLDTKLDAEQEEFVQVIKTSADALNSTIDDILDFSKIEAGRLDLERTDFSLTQIVEASADILGSRARDKGLTLATFVDSGVPASLVGDPARIRQILLNFTSNAIKFSERGLVHVEAAAEPAVGTESGTVWVRLRVRDNGIGISPEAQSRLFAPFSQADSSTTRKYGGTGLGLAICKRLVDAMGGQIGVDSAVGHGSTFWARLPLQVSEHLQDPPEITVQGRVVLAAGGSPSTQEVWRSYCEAWGMRWRVCDGLTGLRAQMQALQGPGQRVDAFLLAEPLEDGTLEEAIAAAQPLGVPVVCCVAEAPRRRAIEALGVAVILEPIRQSPLLDAMVTGWSELARRSKDAAPAPAPGDGTKGATPPDEDPQAPGVIGLQRLADMLDDDRSAIADLLGVFAESMRAIDARVVGEMSGSLAGCKSLAHEIKGMAANIGADALSMIARDMELAAGVGNTAAVRARVPDLQSAIAQAIASAERYVLENRDATPACH